MTRLVLAAVLAAASAAAAADPAPKADPVPKVDLGKIRFPDSPVVVPQPAPPAPAPKADPAAPVRLARGSFYVIASPKPLVIMPGGPGGVTVQERRPPFMLPAAQAINWTPDAKDPDFVTWGPESPYLYVLRPAKTGDVTLTVIPAVNDVDPTSKLQIPLTAKDVLSRQIAVDDGVTPPPAPGPTPTPTPDAVPTKVTGFRVLFLYEKEGNLTQEQLNISSSSRIAAYLNSKCAKGPNGRPEWRKWDMSTVDRPGALDKESPDLRQLYADAKPKLGRSPQVVISVDQNAITRAWGAMTEDEVLALLRQHGG